jgi:2-dehydro-3-deoxy-L-rhamnonate dehydrogenase (NAD+)
MMSFNGKTILVTGAAGDIGSAVAQRFVKEEATILLTDVNREKLNARAEELHAAGAVTRAYVADVSDAAAVEAMVREIEFDGFVIDLLFNNAGYQGLFKKTQEYPAADFAAVVSVNLIGAFNVLRFVSEHMVKNGGGNIVNTASMAGVDAPPNMIAYGASKFGVIGLTGSSAKDLAPYNIRVNSISPAFMGPGFMWGRQVQLQAEAGSQYFDSDPKVVEQQMINSVPMRRYGSIEEIPGTVVYLMSEESSYITGINIPISGGA